MRQRRSAANHEKESVIKPVIPEVEHQVKGILKGDVHTIARSISRLEAGVWSDASLQLLKELYAHTGKAFVLGITGSPGVGKSTLVDRLIERFRAGGSRVAVLAVDPTSPFSGGAILGDRIRMQRHSTDPDVFIRSMATRGKLGGLAPAVHEALIVLDASGYDCILLETVGVGQDEVDVVFAAHMVLVLLTPGLGDDVQTIKAGLMEIADVFVLNKADLEGTDRSEKEILAMLELAGENTGYPLRMVKTVATEGKGVEDLLREISDYRHWYEKESDPRSRLEVHKHRLRELLKARLEEMIRSRLADEELEALAQKLRNRETDPYTVVADIVSRLEDGGHHD